MMPRTPANLRRFRARLIHLLKYRVALRYEYARGSKWAFMAAWWRPDQRQHFAEVGRRIDRLTALCRKLQAEAS